MDNFYQNLLRSRIWSHLRIICICLFLLSSSCGLFESDINKETHKSQIVIGLAGQYAKDEIATVSIDGVVVGNASFNEVATKEVEPGMYKISAIDKKGNKAWSSETVEVKEQQTLNYSLICDPIKLQINIADLCGQSGKATQPMRVKIYDENSIIVLITGSPFFNAGDIGTVLFDHGQRSIYITDAKQNIWYNYNSAYFPYGSTLTADVSCQ